MELVRVKGHNFLGEYANAMSWSNAAHHVQEEVEEAVQVCHYCRRLCEPDMFSSEPIWSCAWCQVIMLLRHLCMQHFSWHASQSQCVCKGDVSSHIETGDV
jgi:hypothetical protein